MEPGYEAAGFSHEDVTDGVGARRLVQIATQAFHNNSVLRSKYATQPTRFADSEVDLDARVRDMAALATHPSLFKDAIAADLASLLVQLLCHENLDVLSSVITVLVDLVDPDAEEDKQPYSDLVDALQEAGVFQSLVSVLQERFAEPTHGSDTSDVDVISTAAISALAIFENVLEVRPDLADKLGSQSGLIQYCAGNLEIFHGYTERSSSLVEVLAMLLQTSDGENRENFGKAGGIDSILRFISCYRKGTAKLLGDEGEMIANMFTVLCASLLRCRANKIRFAKGEGVELMLILMRSSVKRMREPSLRALDFACADCDVTVRRMFDAGGIGVLFSVLMTLHSRSELVVTKSRAHAPHHQVRSEIEHFCGILFNLFRFGDKSSHERLVSKFTETSGSKMEKLLLIYLDTLEVAAKEDGQVSGANDDFAGSSWGDFVSQICSVTIAQLVTLGPPPLAEAVERGLVEIGGVAGVIPRVRLFASNFVSEDGAHGESNTVQDLKRDETIAERDRIAHIADDCENWRVADESPKADIARREVM
jgi:beta-catenin-like protein 1